MGSCAESKGEAGIVLDTCFSGVVTTYLEVSGQEMK